MAAIIAQRDVDAKGQTFADESYIACILNEIMILKCFSRGITRYSVSFERVYRAGDY